MTWAVEVAKSNQQQQQQNYNKNAKKKLQNPKARERATKSVANRNYGHKSNNEKKEVLVPGIPNVLGLVWIQTWTLSTKLTDIFVHMDIHSVPPHTCVYIIALLQF